MMENLGSAIVFNFENYRLCPKEIASTTSFVEAVSLDQIRSPKIDWDLEKTVCTIMEDGQERRCMVMEVHKDVSLKDQNHFVAMNKKRIQVKGICWTEEKDHRTISTQTDQVEVTMSTVSTQTAIQKQIAPSNPPVINSGPGVHSAVVVVEGRLKYAATAVHAAAPASTVTAATITPAAAAAITVTTGTVSAAATVSKKRCQDSCCTAVHPPQSQVSPSRPKRPSTVQSYAVMDPPYVSESDSGESVEGVPKVQRRTYSSGPRDRPRSRSRGRAPRTNFTDLSPLAAKAIAVTGPLGEHITLKTLMPHIAYALSQASALRLAMLKLFSLEELKGGMSMSINVLRQEDLANHTENADKMHLLYAAVVKYRKHKGKTERFEDGNFASQCSLVFTGAARGKFDDGPEDQD